MPNFNLNTTGWMTGALLKKDYYSGGASEIKELEEQADVDVEDYFKITSGSVFIFSSSLNKPEKADIDLSNFETQGFIRTENGKVKTLPIEVKDDYYVNLTIILDTDDLSEGKHDLCLWVRSESHSFEDIECLKLLRAPSPIVYKKMHDELQLDYYISPKSYYVMFGNIKYYYSKLGVSRYTYSKNHDYIIIELAANEWRESVIINSKTGEILEKTIQFDSIWKGTNDGYRIYTCSPEIFTELKIAYLDLNTENNKTNEVMLVDGHMSTCDIKGYVIRIVELVRHEKYKYSEYSTQKDEWMNVIDNITIEDEHLHPADNLEIDWFLETYTAA